MIYANLLQILSVALVAAVIIWGGWAVAGDGLFARQAVVWAANVAMLVTIWLGLRARGQTWSDLGLSREHIDLRRIAGLVLRSIAVLVFALAAFVAAAVMTANLAPSGGSADLSGYAYLQGNLPMLLLALAGVYVVSSLGEEVVYRGFLMTRIAEMGQGSKSAWATAVVVSSIVFGAAHFGWGLAGVIQTTAMGLALALSFLVVKRNLWVLVLAHGYLDTFLLVQIYLAPAGAQ
jgi:membrane protease YdiL (CAAX protease family)